MARLSRTGRKSYGGNYWARLKAGAANKAYGICLNCAAPQPKQTPLSGLGATAFTRHRPAARREAACARTARRGAGEMSPRARSRPERPPSSPTPWGRPRLGRDIVHLDFVGRGSGLDALLAEPLVAAFVGGFAPHRFDHQIAHAVLARCARIASEAPVEALLPRLTEAAYDFFAIGFPFLAHSPKAPARLRRKTTDRQNLTRLCRKAGVRRRACLPGPRPPARTGSMNGTGTIRSALAGAARDRRFGRRERRRVGPIRGIPSRHPALQRNGARRYPQARPTAARRRPGRRHRP